MNKQQACFFCGAPTENQHDYCHFKASFCNLDHQIKWHYKMADPLLISGKPSGHNNKIVVVMHQSDEFNSFPKLSRNIFDYLKAKLTEYEWLLGKGDGQVHIYLGITSTVRIAKEIASRKSYSKYLEQVTSLGQNPIVLAARAGENGGVLLRGMDAADPVYPIDYDTMHSVLENSSNDEIVELLRKKISTVRTTTTSPTTRTEPHQKIKKNNNTSMVLYMSNDLSKYLVKLRTNLVSYLRSSLPEFEWKEYDKPSSDTENVPQRLIFVTTLSTPRVQKEITSKPDYIQYEKLTDNQVILALVIGSDDAEPFNLSIGSYGKIHQLMYNVEHEIHQTRQNKETLEELKSRFI